MVTQECIDDVLYNAQRQGRVSFYMTNYGEEAIQVGSAAGMQEYFELLFTHAFTHITHGFLFLSLSLSSTTNTVNHIFHVALADTDEIYAQYREAGVLLYKGFTMQEFMNQCFATVDDYGKGRQV